MPEHWFRAEGGERERYSAETLFNTFYAATSPLEMTEAREVVSKRLIAESQKWRESLSRVVDLWSRDRAASAELSKRLMAEVDALVEQQPRTDDVLQRGNVDRPGVTHLSELGVDPPGKQRGRRKSQKGPR